MMTRILFALSLGFGGLILATQASHAAAQCGARSAIVPQLSVKYGETRRGIGLAANNAVMELYAAESGSWTITITLPNGMMCLIASGESYETLADTAPAIGDPA